MTHRIHIRIFLPVLLLIIMLPLAAWFIFSITSDWYVRHTAHKNVTELMKEIENEDAKFYYGNLLGGLYRENPVKSRNYEAVKSSKKWENVGNSYIIPALLLYRYSYI